MRRIVLYFFWLGILSTFVSTVSAASAEQAQSKITVLSSIKPVQMIVVAIAGKHINSELLIPDYVSPHDYSFKPSDIRKIKKADLIFRIDEHFETVLERTLESVFDAVSRASKVISLAENPKINLLPVVGEHQHEAEHDNVDMHIFTSPQNALLMAQHIADILIKADVKNADSYQKNLQAFSQTIALEVDQINSRLVLLKDKPFIVFHYSWQYFGAYFDLQKPKIIDLQEGISAGVKTLMNIRKAIASDEIACVFSNPEISAKRTKVLTENLKVKSMTINTMGRGLAVDKNSYIKWLNNAGLQVKRCLEY